MFYEYKFFKFEERYFIGEIYCQISF